MSTDAGSPDSEFEGVSDPSDINQKRRINLVNNLREQFHEQYNKIEEKLVFGQINEQLARKMLRQPVKQYALESEQVIRRNLPDTSDDPRSWTQEQEAAYHTWKECELGSLEMRTKTVEFTGVEEFVEAPRSFTETWRESANNPVSGTAETLNQEQYEIPLEVSERAYRALNYFWSEFDLDIKIDEKLPHDKI